MQELITLADADLELGHHPARDFLPSRQVLVWIRYPSQTYLVQGPRDRVDSNSDPDLVL
ncbi:hypothetical protein [Arthrobacter subterraneus]|uniref:hypothetical protein n=1 Tax=Arthrobacter subterraneus TaxID=335973 RepID=UPI001587BC43|nr:hypothetical protein [Arthrobacter subterraneus]